MTAKLDINNKQGWFADDVFGVNFDLETPLNVLKEVSFSFYTSTDPNVAKTMKVSIDKHEVCNYVNRKEKLIKPLFY